MILTILILSLGVIGFLLKRLKDKTVASDQRLMEEILRLRYDLIDSREDLRIARRKELKSKQERDAEQIKMFDALQKVKAEF